MDQLDDILLETLSFYNPLSREEIIAQMDTEKIQACPNFTIEDLDNRILQLIRRDAIKVGERKGDRTYVKNFPTRTKWISHRGIATDFTENSLGAFQAAVENGFDCLETDLRLTSDGHIVLCHDSSLCSISMSDRVVSQTSRSELSKIILNKGDGLLFFDQFIDQFSEIDFTLDIKKESGIEVINKLITYNLDLSKIRFLLWDKFQENYLLEKFPGALVYARKVECYRSVLAIVCGLSALAGINENKIYALPPKIKNLKILSPFLVEKYQKSGAKVLGYLPSSEDEVNLCIESKVAEILLNGPKI